MATTETNIAEVDTNGHHSRATTSPSPPATAPAAGLSSHEHEDALPPKKPWSLGPIRRKRREAWQADHRRWLQTKRDEDPHHAFQRSFEILPGSRYLLHNRTPYLIRLVHPTDTRFGEVLLPPFAERVVKGARIRPFEEQLKGHRQRHEIFLRRHDERVTTFDKLILLVWLSLVAVLGVAIYDVLSHGTVARPEFFFLVAGTAIVIVLVLAVAAFQETRRKRDASATATEAGDVAFGIGGAYSDGNETARHAQHLLTLVLVLVVGGVLPVTTILFATDTADFLVMTDGLHVKDGMESRLVSRLIQITYTVILSLFPALLFFQFDRQRAGSLRAGWVRNLFRMDSRMRTIADVNATYGTAMYDASGNSDDSVKVLGGKHSPLIVCTILISLGWTILVVRTESYDFRRTTEAAVATEVAQQAADQANEAAETAATAEAVGDTATAEAAAADAAAAKATAAAAESVAGDLATTSNLGATDDDGDAPPDEGSTEAGGDDTAGDGSISDAAQADAAQADQAVESSKTRETEISSTSFFQVLAPNPSASGMAFLGAYFFGVYLLLRSYFRGDLRAKTYNQITARLVTVVVVAYLMNAILADSGWQESAIWALAFLAGVIPTAVLEFLFKTVGGAAKRIGGGRFTPSRPLEHLDGVDIYDASRLESEGIPDVAALANSNLADLMIRTRLPIGRLVDWADQAALMVVVSPGTTSRLDRRIWALRARGVRTGTDMITAIEDRKGLDAVRKCLRLDPERGSDGIAVDSADDDETVESANDRAGTATNHDAKGTPERRTDPTPVIHQKADLAEMAEAIRRQPVMRQILQWRSSPLDEIDHVWIELPAMGDVPEPSAIYRGPRPNPAEYQHVAEAPGA